MINKNVINNNYINLVKSETFVEMNLKVQTFCWKLLLQIFTHNVVKTEVHHHHRQRIKYVFCSTEKPRLNNNNVKKNMGPTKK